MYRQVSIATQFAIVLATAGALAACAGNDAKPTDAHGLASPKAAIAAVAPVPPAGVRPQDDMYRAVNGEWLATHAIPADRSEWGAF